MSRNKGWFRFYDRMIDSPQVLELNDAEFRLLVSVWCLASASEQRGMLPFSARALQRRVLPDHSTQDVEAMLAHLVALDLLEPLDGGRVYAVKRWDEHQYEHPSWAPEARRQQKFNERQALRGESQARRNDVASSRNIEGDPERETDPEDPLRDHVLSAAAAHTSLPRSRSAADPSLSPADEAPVRSERTPAPELPPKPPRLKPIYGQDSVPMQLARTLAAGIHRNKPDAKLPRDGFQEWAREFDLMLRVDHRPREKIEAVIAYAMASTFWRRVIFSARKIREKFDVIDAQRQEDNSRGQQSRGRPGLHGAGGRVGARPVGVERPDITSRAYYEAAARRLGQGRAGEGGGDALDGQGTPARAAGG